MAMLTGSVDAVIGVDTHRDHHTVAIVDPTGGGGATVELAADALGYRRMLAFAREHAPAGGSGRSRAPAASVPD